MPLGQLSAPGGQTWHSFGLSLVVRATGDPNNLVTSITQAVHQVDPERPILDVKTMQDIVAESLTPQRFNMMLLAGFGGLALLLAAVGIYSVLAYSVRQRVREIGVRMALGAQIYDVLQLVIVQAMKPKVLGLTIGVCVSLALARVLASLVFGFSTQDAMTYISVSALLGQWRCWLACPPGRPPAWTRCERCARNDVSSKKFTAVLACPN